MMVDPSLWLSSLGAATRSLASAPADLDTRLRQALQACLRGLGDVAWIDLCDDAGVMRRRILVAQDGELAQAWSAIGVNASDHHAAWCAAASGAEVRRDVLRGDDVIQLTASSSSHLRMLGRCGPTSLLSLPLLLGETLVGAVTIVMRAPRRSPASAQSESLREFASLVTAQIGYARFTAQQAQTHATRRPKDEFLAVLGHELRNPLAPISAALELMARREPGRLVDERLLMGRQVAHLSRLVDDLLDVSRLARGKVQLRLERLDLRTVVSQAVADTAPSFEGRASLRVRQPEKAVWVEADPVRMLQVFTQLLLNAAKFTPANGDVHLELRREHDRAWIEVQDSGCGIDAQLLPRVFDLFVQAPQSLERRAGGLGLGLRLVRSLVDLHGGHVTARSAGAGQGATFEVCLPAIDIMEEALLASGPAASAAISTQGVRILVVDDNRDAARMLADLLGLIGFEVRTADDGHEALALLPVFRPQIAVLDIGLPEMDGYELARRIRDMPAHAGLPLVALTGYGSDADRAQARAAGFNEHLVKPVLIDPLLATVDRVLGLRDARHVMAQDPQVA